MEKDITLRSAALQVDAVLQGKIRTPHVKAFFDEPTFTASYVVHDPATKVAAIIDSVLDFDHPSGRTSYESADDVIAYVEAEGLKVEWLLETHAHADHLSAAPYLQQKLGGRRPTCPDQVETGPSPPDGQHKKSGRSFIDCEPQLSPDALPEAL
jgi:glyoxylase-like metal-dependent hydrolase (beta-lactamase superfamily II)